MQESADLPRGSKEEQNLTETEKMENKEESSDAQKESRIALGTALLNSARLTGKAVGYLKRQCMAGKEAIGSVSKTQGRPVIDSIQERVDRMLAEVDRQTNVFCKTWKQGFREGLAVFKTTKESESQPEQVVQDADNASEKDEVRVEKCTRQVEVVEPDVSARAEDLNLKVKKLQEKLDRVKAEQEQIEDEKASGAGESGDASRLAEMEARIQGLTEERKQLQKELSSSKRAIKRVREAYTRFQSSSGEKNEEE